MRQSSHLVITGLAAAAFLLAAPLPLLAQGFTPERTLKAHLHGLLFFDEEAEIDLISAYASLSFDTGVGVDVSWDVRKRKSFSIETSLSIIMLEGDSVMWRHWGISRRSKDRILFVPIDVGINFYFRENGRFKSYGGPFLTLQSATGEIGDAKIKDMGLSAGWSFSFRRQIGDGPWCFHSSARYRAIVVEWGDDLGMAHGITVGFGIAQIR
jgi:hypothetical protein